MAHGFFKDSDGNISSKRITGFVSLVVGLMMGITLFFLAIFSGTKDSDTAFSVFVSFLSAGGSLLGIGTFEKIGRKKDD